MQRSLLALILLVVPISTEAQSAPTAIQATGSVTGHVICSDTQRPARLAEVKLVPVAFPASTTPAGPNDDPDPGKGLTPVETDLNGRFTMHNVKPGTYYLEVQLDGYLVPLLSFSRAELAKPDADVEQRIHSELQRVTVAANTTTRADATLDRGGSIAGTVTYDDGTAAGGVPVTALRSVHGEFTDSKAAEQQYLTTDGRGHYLIDNLPAGKYLVRANFALNESSVMSMPIPGGVTGTMQVNINKTVFSLSLFSGSVFRKRDASAIDVAVGAASNNVDLTLPLAKLHEVSGSVLSPGGNTVSRANVNLLWADDREPFTDVPIDRSDNQFHFLYIPEGSYILRVEKAEDVTQVEVPNPKGSVPPFHMEDRPVRSFGTAEIPLAVTTDQEGVLIAVPAAKSRQ